MSGVLLVDDDVALRDLLRIAFRRSGRPVEVVGEAKDGAGAVARAAEPDVRVVVLDARLPDAEGVDVARRITGARDDVEVALYTGYVDEEVRTAAAAAGCSAVFPKDDLTGLVAWVADAVARAS